MIRFALIVASTLGFVLTAALGNFMAPLLQELERFRPQEQQEPQTPVQSRVPALGGLCLMVSTLAAVGVGWTAACIAQPTLLGSESQLMTRLLIALFGAQAFGAIGLADDAARLRSRAQLGLRRLPRLALEAAAAAAVLVLLAVNGCLYLAGVLGCVPLCIGYAELSIPLALPFWAEGGMVLLQILYHRITGRPLFRAAPLHRWLEARGAGPVTVFYWLCALGVCGLALALAFVR